MHLNAYILKDIMNMQIEYNKAQKKLNILFVMLHPGYVRNYESTLCELADRGHCITVEFNRPNKQTEKNQLDELVNKYHSQITFSKRPFPTRVSKWRNLSRAIYGVLDYLRYLHPVYYGAPKLRKRLEIKARSVTGAFSLKLLLLLTRIVGVRAFEMLFGLMAKMLPPDIQITKHILKLNPDIILVTPLVDIASDQTDIVKSAKELGIPCGLCVASWDNLTNKGLIRINPDLVIVWNENQKREAVELHHINPEKVAVTGAQCYDKWFGRQPSLEKKEFLRKVGLPEGKPYLLYLCSSPFISPDEVGFVQDWVHSIREDNDPAIREMSLLVRPHPQNAEQWRNVNFEHISCITIFPKLGANPVTDDTRNDYFDSIFHASAIVGVNTSAMIESGIAGKPVFTIRDARFRDTQDGTLHFEHLVTGGLLHVAESFEQHLQQLQQVLLDVDTATTRVLKFIKDFVRPRGLEVSCTPIIVDIIERLDDASVPRKARIRVSLSHYFTRILLYPMVLVMNLRARKTNSKIESSQKNDRTERDVLSQKHNNQKLSQALTNIIKSYHKKRRNIAMARSPSKNKRSKRRKNGELPTFLKVARPALLPVANYLITRPIMKQHIVPWVLRNEAGINTLVKEVADVEDEIKKLVNNSKEPILVGPWISEVGFEVLYWIPFLRWVMSRYNIPKDRITVISRGGTESWYKGICGNYIDIFEFYTVDEYKTLNEKRIDSAKTQKHNHIGEFDDKILEKIKNHTGIEGWSWLHPSYMYRLFRSYWGGRTSISLVGAHTQYQKLVADEPSIEIMGRLPKEFVAVKFYFSACFPESAENKQFISRLLSALSQKTDVVLLSTGLDLDDHNDFNSDVSHRIHRFEDVIDPRNNLALQTAIISKASAFYGTYGGFSYLAPIYGVPSVAFFSREDQFLPVHLDVAYRASRVLKFGYFNKVKSRIDSASIHENMKHEFIALNTESISLFENLTLFNSAVETRTKINEDRTIFDKSTMSTNTSTYIDKM